MIENLLGFLKSESLTNPIVLGGALMVFKSEVKEKLGVMVTFVKRRLFYSVSFTTSWIPLETVALFFSKVVKNRMEDTIVFGDNWASEEKIKKIVPFNGKPHYFWYKKRPFVFTSETQKEGFSSTHNIKVTTLTRFKNISDTLICELEKEIFKEIQVFVPDPNGTRRKTLGKRYKDSYIDTFGHLSTVLEASKRVFERNEKKLCFLLKGVPGSGKTSLIHVVASELGLPIYYIKAKDSAELSTSFMQISKNSVIVFEDIDGSNFDISRTGDSEKVCISTLLNCLDGFLSVQNSLVFITTNDTVALDPALTRKGRMDYILDFPKSFEEKT